MKKVLAVLGSILLLAALCIGGFVAWAYFTADETAVSYPSVQFADTQLLPQGTQWHTPVLHSLLMKSYGVQADAAMSVTGTYADTVLPLSVPQAADATLVICKGEDVHTGEVVYTGSAADYDGFTFTENGLYSAQLVLAQQPDKTAPYGTFTYWFSFKIDIQPIIAFSADTAQQGDIITAYVYTGLTDDTPSITTQLGNVVEFLPVWEHTYAAYIPVNYACTPGSWDITVTLGSTVQTQTVQVTQRDYTVQYMTISEDTTNETMNNPNGPANWREKIWPLWESADDTRYWTENFMQPCEARISTEFGLYRYTNGSTTPERHTGIDIAADEGTDVAASNSGRVVLAEYIIYTGNTVVIEHGGGLKTYYFHMRDLAVQENDMVEKGDIIGHVGTTGYSTGAHLHFEVKLGKTSLSPWGLFDGSSGVYYTGS